MAVTYLIWSISSSWTKSLTVLIVDGALPRSPIKMQLWSRRKQLTTHEHWKLWRRMGQVPFAARLLAVSIGGCKLHSCPRVAIYIFEGTSIVAFLRVPAELEGEENAICRNNWPPTSCPDNDTEWIEVIVSIRLCASSTSSISLGVIAWHTSRPSYRWL